MTLRKPQGKAPRKTDPGGTTKSPHSADDIDSRVREAMEAAALLGPRFSVADLVYLGIEPEVLDHCFSAGVFMETDPGVAELAGSAAKQKVYDTLPWDRKRRLHLRIAETLRGMDGRLAEAAAHYAAAHAYPEARRAWIESAAAACAEKRYREALDSFANALGIWPAGVDDDERQRVLREAARCAANHGEHTHAERAWKELFRGALDHGDFKVAIEACHHLADVARHRCDPVAVREHLTAAAGLADRMGDCREIARNRFALAAFLTDRIRLHGALKEIETAEHAAAQGGDPELHSEILGFRGLILAMLGHSGEARETVDASLQLALENNKIEAVAIAYRRLANIREYSADYPGERDAQLRAISFCREKKLAPGVQSCLGCLSYAFFRTGQWKRSLDTAKEVLSAADSDPDSRATALLVRLLIATFRGERRKADPLLDQALMAVRRENLVGLEFFANWARAVLAEADNRPEDAAAIYAENRMLWEETEDVHDVVPSLFSASAFHAARGATADLRDCVDVLNRIASRNDTVETRAARDAAQAEAAWIDGDLSAAIRLLRQATEAYDRLETPVERALVRHRLCLALTANGNEADAIKVRDEAESIAKHLGMRLVLEKLEKEAPSPINDRSKAAPAAGLTNRQLEVLRLMAQGLTNKEIADRLSLSTRTVEMHVARTLDRLHCRTRAQAVHKAAELGVE